MRLKASAGCVIGLGAKFYVLSPKVGPVREMHSPSDEATIKRGEYLARHVYGCTGCHSKVHADLPATGETYYYEDGSYETVMGANNKACRLDELQMKIAS